MSLPVTIFTHGLEKGTMRVKHLAQEHNTVPWPGLEPGPLDLESRALTTYGNRKLLAVKKQNGKFDHHSLGAFPSN